MAIRGGAQVGSVDIGGWDGSLRGPNGPLAPLGGDLHY